MLTIESTRSCGQTPRLLFLLEELSEPYELILREDAYFFRTHGRPGPIVRDGDLVFRHAAIAFRHLARTRGGGRLMPSDPIARTHVDEVIQDAWMGLGLVVALSLGLRRAGVPDDVTRGPILGTLRELDRMIGARDHVVGETLTAADCALAGLSRLGASMDLSSFPSIERYAAALESRPAFLRGRRRLAGVAGPDAVLSFWFGAPTTTERETIEKIRRWFVDGPALDATIRERFGATLEAALRGELNDWAQTPRGALALVVVLDQLARHAFRGDARAFDGTDAAVGVALAAVERGDLERLEDTAERSFLISPLHHAEDVELQRRHEALMAEIGRGAAPHERVMAEAGAEQSGKWRAIIERFGRFPHRNAVLGRETTPEEAAFLESFATVAPPKVAQAIGGPAA